MGRASELATLTELLHADARFVIVEGPTGVGKSALIDRFLAELARRDPRLCVLRGGCNVFEHVRYNAFDDVFAGLAKLAAARALPRPHAAALSHLRGEVPWSQGAEPASRSRLFDAIVGLLALLAREHQIVLALDDLHWADRDSLLLLQHVLDYFDGSGLFVLAARRVTDADEPALLTGPHQRLFMHGLAPHDAQALAATLLGSRQQALEPLLRHADGNPLHLQELAHLSGELAMPARELTVERAIARRAAALLPEAARILQRICVAGAPVPYGVLADAADLKGAALYSALAKLRIQRLLQPGATAAEAVPYHDRVREAVVAGLDLGAIVGAHLALAEAWQHASAPNAERVARHYVAAREPTLACPFLERAGQQAFDSAAYERAIELWTLRLSIARPALAREERWRLEIARSDALAFCGDYARSAALLEQLGDADANATMRRELLVRSAQRLLQSGAVAGGVAAAARALRSVQLDLPRFDLEIVLRLAGNTLGARWQGGASLLGAGESSVEQLDTLWRLIQPLYFADLLRSLLTAARHLRLAQQLGDPKHLALSCGANSVMIAMTAPDSARAHALSRMAESWRARSAEPSTRAYLAFTSGARALFNGNTRDAIVALRHAERIYRFQCPDEGWLRTVARAAYLRALFFRGRHRRFASDAEAWTRDARARADSFGLTQYSIVGQGALRHLMENNPEAALNELKEAAQPWRGARVGIVQWLSLLTNTTLVSYSPTNPTVRDSFEQQARFSLAARALQGAVPAGMLVSQVLAQLAWELSSQREVRPSARLRRDAERLAESRAAPWARAMGTLALAQLHFAAGAHAHARRCALQAAELHGRLGYAPYELAARVVVAATTSLAGARSVRDALHDRLRAQGWRDPKRALMMYLPLTCHDRIDA